MPYFTHKGVRTYYEVAGEGPPMVLIHATPWDHSMWVYQIAHFSTWFRVIAVDMRSFGRSDAVTEPFPIDALVDETIALCEHEKAKDAVVIGASLGSRLGYLLAHKRPDLFKAAILVGGNAQSAGNSDSDKRRAERIRRYRDEPTAQVYEWQLHGTLSEGFQKTPLGKYFVAMMLEQTPRVVGLARSLIALSMSREDLAPLLPEIKIPIMVCTGELDRSLEGARDAARSLKQGKHVVIPNAGHCCCLEDPAAFDAAVIDFLKAHKLMPGH